LFPKRAVFALLKTYPRFLYLTKNNSFIYLKYLKIRVEGDAT
jgi:hypothetical protein